MEDQPRKSSSKSFGLIGAVAVVIIIGVAYVASRPADAPAPQQAENAVEKPAEPQVAALATAHGAPAAFDMSLVMFHEQPVDAPTTVFKDPADADTTLQAFAGKVLVVNFWATWCAPCVKEMPMLDALNTKMSGEGVQVLAISQDRDGMKSARPFAEKHAWKLPIYIEAPGKFMREAKLNGLPTTLIIDKQGKEVARVEGELDWNAPELEKILRDLLAKS